MSFLKFCGEHCNAAFHSRTHKIYISVVFLLCLTTVAIRSGCLQSLGLYVHRISIVTFTSLRYNVSAKQVEDSAFNNSTTVGQTSLELTTQRFNKTTQQPQPLRYVSFDNCINDGRRLGNLLFDLAAVIFVAELSGRKPVLQESSKISLEKTFNLNLERVKNLCPCHVIGESHHLAYDINTEKITFTDANLINKTILVAGFRQSWKYTLSIERRLRKHLVFREEIQNFAESFLHSAIPPYWKKAGFVRVGVHSRRGDNLIPHFVNYGYTVPNETYFYKAMKFFTDRYSRVQFVVSSDDFNWTRQHIININNISSAAINIAYTVNNTAGQDFAILSMCDHVIMSTGTFGWWAAWLAKGTTIYYGDWPRRGSSLEGQFRREDFFPPNWIPMTNKN